jgi:hypothetical protein
VSGSPLDGGPPPDPVVPLAAEVPFSVPVIVPDLIRPQPVVAEPAQQSVESLARTVDELALLVLAVPGVVRLHGGGYGEIGTYLPGRRVAGVKLTDDRIEVHVVLAAGVPVRDAAQRIHAALAAVTAGRQVHVCVDDVAVV